MPDDISHEQNLSSKSFKSKNLSGKSFEGKDLTRSDFRGANIRGANFTNAKLVEANFSSADIRGANFTNAIFIDIKVNFSSEDVQGANFSSAKAGLQKRWIAFLLVASFLLSAISAYFPAAIGLLATTMRLDLPNLLLGVVILFFLIIFRRTIIHKGLNLAENFAQVFAISFGFGFLVLIASGDFANAIPTAFALGVTFVVVFAAAVAVTFAGAFAIAIATATARVFVEVVTFAGAGAGAGAAIYTVYVNANYLFDGLSDFDSGALAYTNAVGSFLGSGFFALLSSYIASQSFKGDEKYTVIRKAAMKIAAIGGTKFYNANLTKANFQNATLKSTDFREANLTRTCFYKAKELDSILPGATYLKNPELLQLLITPKDSVPKDSVKKNFNNQVLQGVNLDGYDLTGYQFIGTNFYQSSLKEANLKQAILVRTQFESADLTGAKLTEACIEGWLVTKTTKLEDIECDSIFMKLSENGSKIDQMPPRGKFKPGEFKNFIKTILDTIELYNDFDMNPKVALQVIESLSKNYSTQLEIVGIRRTEYGINLIVKSSRSIDEQQLKDEYHYEYNQTLSLDLADPQKILPDNTEILEIVTNMVEEAKNRPTTYVKYNSGIVAGIYNNQGDTMSDKSNPIHFGNVGGDVTGVAGGDISGVAGKDITGTAGGDISGTVTTTIAQLEKSDTPEAPKLAELLKQLQEAIESDTNLSDDDKVTALEQVKAIAESGQKPKEGAMQKVAKNALTMLRGTIAILPSTASLFEACNKLLPLISKLLGLG
ncbi:hypothetical protein NIES593_00010 [Hydrococcus rivularis NIES-593]|uniref:Low-complexity protein n=1 Tax=Hydrococcus rivularis NIES-593 TaxID=1921803 RepID=A0A1U7HSD4_9CYAN|nr:pentapeptide repeat-containing protein [Hydrococcus rivularis]OKH26492.1 hypothetical protein NIES593_00010 [Hydrococcus rivularis NIES-593]